ncbi:MAG TPA: hypothetical protein VJ179_00955 [Patescibacteria group bacterium]|nr:hypothetical protein [Patescibacteria group bacterium]
MKLVKKVVLGCMMFIPIFVLLWFVVDRYKEEISLYLEGKRVSTQPVRSESNDEGVVHTLSEQVTPKKGFSLNIDWSDIGVKLVQSGAIDMKKYTDRYKNPSERDLFSYLTEKSKKGLAITNENASFWLNTLWAFGLTQKSDVLEKGVMGTTYKDRIGTFASTGGWTLGQKDADELFDSQEIVRLTDEQQDLVWKIADGIYRPCCGNPTSFPDCNHGMAMLGLLEIMASQGFSEEEMFNAALAFQSYWFPQTYTEIAYYFQEKEHVSWRDVDPKRVLSSEFSSSSGYQALQEKIKDLPRLPGSTAQCGV